MDERRLAWMAGLLDGEGSIGISRCGKSLKPLVQMSMTSRETIDEAIRVLKHAGIPTVGYTYQERDPANHQDAHCLRVARMGDIRRLAQLMIGQSTTKQRHWAVMLAFTASRIERWGLAETGRLHRGGDPQRKQHPYTDEEIRCYEELRQLNLRGAERKAMSHAP